MCPVKLLPDTYRFLELEVKSYSVCQESLIGARSSALRMITSRMYPYQFGSAVQELG